MAASSGGSKRLPISCQACRTRKIRCTRDGRPCQTCVSRNLGADKCIYLGNPRLLTGQESADPVLQNQWLRARVRELEATVQEGRSSEAQKSATDHSRVDSLIFRASTAGTVPEFDDSMTKDEGFMTSNLGPVESLHISASGYARYIPFASQWESLVMKSPATEALQDTSHELLDDDDLQVPFASNKSISRSDLLVALPPRTCCDALKDMYFRAFAPVSALTGLARKAKY